MFNGMDDIFGDMNRMMNRMNNMMGMMGGHGLMNPAGNLLGQPFLSPFDMMNQMSPMMNNQIANPMNSMNNQLSMFGGPSKMSVFSMAGMPGQSVSYSSKVMSISNDGTGRPQVYEQTSSSICGPNGVRETKETVKDSRTGLQQIKVGRHINDRGHLKQKKRNVYNGEESEEEEFVNIDETELDQFHSEYQQKTKDFRQKYQSIANHPNQSRNRLAITNEPSNQIKHSQQVPTSSQAYNLINDSRPPSRGKSKIKDAAEKKTKKKSKKPY